MEIQVADILLVTQLEARLEALHWMIKSGSRDCKPSTRSSEDFTHPYTLSDALNRLKQRSDSKFVLNIRINAS